ncbi:MAG: c-type cytochrome, partial [Planctomycetales bacterium]|nr:c-type cytochrome [Planctomycetales bacterium]
FTGYLKLPLRGDFRFSLRGRGSARLTLGEEQILAVGPGDLATAAPATVELAKGWNKLRLEYESPATGDAAVRLVWESDEFPSESVSPQILSHDGRDAAWQKGQALRQGRQMFAQGRCLKCHTTDEKLAAAMALSGAMPELQADAPSLVEAGGRLREEWIARWIVAPSALRNRTTMPHVLAHLDAGDAAQEAADIAACLAGKTGDTPAQAKPEADAGDVKAGLKLFEERGCIACHRFSPPEAEDEFDRLSLHFAAAKYQPTALARYIADSRAHYAWSRMPKFVFSPEEAAALAAYVASESHGELPQAADALQGDAQRGKKLLATRGCANCHVIERGAPTSPATAKNIAAVDAQKGCLAEDAAAGAAPRFGFSAEERAALVALLADGPAGSLQDTPMEFARRQFAAIRCNACHSRDNQEAVLPYALTEFGELGKSPEPVPNLTWAGEKLQAAWTEQLFLGKLQYRPRPHFQIRMPAFPQRGVGLAQGISAEHGLGPLENPQPAFNKDLAQIGGEVAAMNTGLACHRCHAIGDKQAVAPFEARSTNLSYASDRLRYDFYHRWMRDPLRVDPETKMIKFAQDGVRTGLTNFYEGEARQQFEAVWHYLHLL